MTNWRPWLIVISTLLASIVLFVLGFWWLVTSINISNTSFAIKARHYYYLNLAPRVGKSLDKLPFSIEAVQKMETENGAVYLYTMLGKYKEVDDQNQILYLTTREGKMYGFNYAFMPVSELTYRAKGESGVIEQKSFSTEPLQEGDSMVAQWTDSRTLEQILIETEVDPQKLVNPYLTVDDFTVIVKN